MSISLIRRTVALGTVAALTLALSACGGDSDDASSDPTVTPDETTAEATADAMGEGTDDEGATVEPTDDASADEGTEDEFGTVPGAGGPVCDLLDTATIETITGLPFSTTEPMADSAGDEQTTCEWSLEGENIAIVQVLLITEDGYSLDIQRDAAQSMFEDVVDVDVAGANDAFSYMGGLVVAMDDGDDYVQVMYMSAFQSDTAPMTLQLAEEVMSNR